jgi:GDP/UDP-N,N'-diacetylbacillosamine 2-epimerase (hydrolysing)
MGYDRMKKKILYVSGTRADYGLMRSVLSQISSHPGMSLEIVVTGMHVMPEFGETIQEIIRDGFSCHRLNLQYTHDTADSMAVFIGRFIQDFTLFITKNKPDFILILGDRGEMLGAAVTGAYLGIPVVHLHGGEVSGTVDDIARQAITKLSHIHLPATELSAARIIRMGENPDTVHVVGAPGLDEILSMSEISREELCTRFHLDPSQKLIIVLQHPVTLDGNDPALQIQQTLESVQEIPAEKIVIYPNADTGGRAMIKVIKKFENIPRFHIFPSISHSDFLNLLRISSAIVGNSSSGIIEAPSFGVPAINIGSRQHNRQKGENVIECGYDKIKISAAIHDALNDEEFKCRVKKAKNPYGDGKSGDRIIDILEKTEITSDLVQKRMMY